MRFLIIVFSLFLTVSTSGQNHDLIYKKLGQGYIYLGEKDYENALRIFHEVREYANKNNLRSLELNSITFLALVYEQIGDQFLRSIYYKDMFSMVTEYVAERGFRDYVYDMMMASWHLIKANPQDIEELFKYFFKVRITAKATSNFRPSSLAKAYVEWDTYPIENSTKLFSDNKEEVRSFFKEYKIKGDELLSSLYQWRSLNQFSFYDLNFFKATVTGNMAWMEALFLKTKKDYSDAVNQYINKLYSNKNIKALVDNFEKKKEMLNEYIKEHWSVMLELNSAFDGAFFSVQHLSKYYLHLMHLNPNFKQLLSKYNDIELSKLQQYSLEIIKGAKTIHSKIRKYGGLDVGDIPRVLPTEYSAQMNASVLIQASQYEGRFLFSNDPLHLKEGLVEINNFLENSSSISQRFRLDQKKFKGALLLRKGLINLHLKNYEEAEKIFNEAHQLFLLINSHQDLWIIEFLRAINAELNRKPQSILNHLKRSISCMDKMRSAINEPYSRERMFDEESVVYDYLISSLIKQDLNEDAFYYADKAKSRVFLEKLITPSVTRSNSTDANVNYDELMQTLSSQHYQQTQQQLLRQAQTLEVKDVLTYLPKSSSLISYYLMGNKIYISLIDTNKKLTIRSSKINYDELNKLIDDFRKRIILKTDERAIAKKLWILLFEPISENSLGKSIYVVPHGLLHNIPFQALYDGNNYLIEKNYSFKYLPNATILNKLKKPVITRNSKVSIVHNPSGDLQSASQEAEAIESKFINTYITKTNTSQAQIVQALQESDVVHFATHGTLVTGNPLLSNLALPNNHFLNVAEIASLELKSQLVNLSACNTNLGRISVGDEIEGIARAFLLAGSQSLLAGQWNISDPATYKLNEVFYTLLLDGSEIGYALQEAQRQVMNDDRFRLPYYWAPFIYIGF